MKKIGILTFHWATNYGAVLQCYALQETLKHYNDYSVEIIDYYPNYLKTSFKSVFSARSFHSLKVIVSQIKRETKIKRFRKNHLKLSSEHYNYGKEIRDNYDIIICGSDQIWNSAFVLNGEKKTTLTYYLDFAPKDVTRIAYACSFGADYIPDNVLKMIRPELDKFKYISVRENTGKEILDSMGIVSRIVCDPTLLLASFHYTRLLNANPFGSSYCFLYFLHGKKMPSVFYSSIDTMIIDGSDTSFTVEDWLTRIYYSQIVYTNSYHCLVFSLLFHKDFYVFGVSGYSMNNRILTLLERVDLLSRFINVDGNEDDIFIPFTNEPIDWEKVDLLVNEFRKESINYLNKISIREE